MLQTSIRTIALNYFKKEGLQVQKLENDIYRVAPEVCQTHHAGEKSKYYLFNGQPLEQDKDKVEVLTAASPLWRQMLDSLTDDVAISYRYLISGVLTHPDAQLQRLIGTKLALQSAKLTNVSIRQALGVWCIK
jgi:hypothetical protein